MYTLLVAAAVAAIVFLAVAVVFQPIAALVPAVLAFGLAGWFLLRRVNRLVEAEVGKMVPMLQARQIAEAQAHLVGIQKRWGRWMPLLDGQMEAQIGILDYLQMKWDASRPHLEKGLTRNWIANVCLGAIDWREGKKDSAYARFAAAARIQPKEAILYVVHAALLVRDGHRDRALDVVGQGLVASPDSEKLKKLQKQLANKQKVDPTEYGDDWYQFFPEDLQRKMLVRGRRDGPPPGMQLLQPRFGARHAPRR